MSPDGLREWFDHYLEAFAAAARRDGSMSSLLDHYAVPLTVTTDEGVVTLATDHQVASVMQSQVDALYAQGYGSTDVAAFEVSAFNASSALLSTALIRRTVDGDDIAILAISYVVADLPAGRRIALMAVHSGS